MRVSILDNRVSLWQWDTGQYLVVEDADHCQEVQFGLGTSADALVVKIESQEGKRIAPIPNILLQTPGKLQVYLFYEEERCGTTFYHTTLDINKRPKPEDYVYTETEVLNYTYLEERLKNLEGEGLANAVAAYLEENPVEAGATAEEAAQIRQNKQYIETLNREKLSADALPGAVNEALAQAKASSLFDGADGKDGVDGKDGYTPVKGVDYFDGKDGQDGKDGADGYTPQKGIDYFDGEKGEQGIQGEKGDTGATGEKGADGYSPVRGTDYWTEADRAEIKSYVDTAILGGAW